MGTEKTSPEPKEQPEQAASGKPDLYPYARALTLGLIKDDHFWTRFTGARKAAMLILHGVLGIAYLLSLPLILQPFGIALCCALVGIGGVGLRYGLAGAWKSLEGLCAKIFPWEINPMRFTRLAAAKAAKKIAALPLVKALRARMDGLAERIACSERFIRFAALPPVQALLKSRLMARARRGLTQKQQDVFLAGLTVQGSLMAVGFCTVAIAAHATVLPAITVGGVLSVGMLAATSIIGANALNLFRSAKTLMKMRRQKKKGIVLAPVPMTCACRAANDAATFRNRKLAVFNRKSGKQPARTGVRTTASASRNAAFTIRS